MSDTEQQLTSLKIDRRSRSGRRSLTPLLLLIGIAIVGGIGGVALWRYLDDSALEVRTAVARAPGAGESAAAVLNGTGYVVARRKATVSSKTSGKVVDIFIEEGMKVDAGQVLAQLDDSYQMAQRSLAQSQLAEHESSLAEVALEIEEALVGLRRIQPLAKQKFASEDAAESAQFRLDRMRARQSRLNKAIKVSQDRLALHEQLVSDMKVRAPFGGIVIAKAAQPGESISPVGGGGEFTRTGICTIVDMESLEVEVDVSEAYINRVKPGQNAIVQPTAFPEARLSAEVIAIIPTANRAKETVRVRVGFTERDERILPDMGARVSFLEAGSAEQTARPPEGVTVPASALTRGKRGPDSAWIIESDRLVHRDVQVAEADEVLARLTAGIDPGDVVVIGVAALPAGGLVEGRAVVVVR